MRPEHFGFKEHPVILILALKKKKTQQKKSLCDIAPRNCAVTVDYWGKEDFNVMILLVKGIFIMLCAM